MSLFVCMLLLLLLFFQDTAFTVVLMNASFYMCLQPLVHEFQWPLLDKRGKADHAAFLDANYRVTSYKGYMRSEVPELSMPMPTKDHPLFKTAFPESFPCYWYL